MNPSGLMDLSVIIVSYNVKYFLEQCLYSVLASSNNILSEIIVVDNNSVDGTCQMLKGKFPSVGLISNKENLGFARACNQGLRQSKGRYVLLLNPDTVIQEDTLRKCVDFMDEHSDAGCMGVKMIDGRGRYLPESKRALPVPAVSFFKIFGLTSLFPNSRLFGRYYLGHLDNNLIHEVDVLTGAFMLIRRSVLDKAGLLDEDFFMYGEDIDLSYRIKLSGYKVYYYPGTTIIHYKGESTKKASFNYVYLFYNAMAVFANKHFSGTSARPLIFLIHMAILFRAAFALVKRFVKCLINPLADAIVIFAGYYFFLPVWEKVIFNTAGGYPPEYLSYVIPGYIIVWIASIYFNEGYEKSVRLMSIVRGVATGTLLILIIYSLLPETLRFSRALIVIGAAWTMVISVAVRYLLNIIDPVGFRFDISGKKKKIVIIGGVGGCRRVEGILKKSASGYEVRGFVSSGAGNNPASGNFLGNIDQIRDIVFVHSVDEIIFCSGDLSSRDIIKTMLLVSDPGVTFKIAAPDTLSIIGSNSADSAGEFYNLYSDSLAKSLNRTKKRVFDVIVSLVFIIFSPVIILTIKNPGGLFKNILTTFLGITTWVGYYNNTPANPELPALKKGIVTPSDIKRDASISGNEPEDINLMYARNYSVRGDAGIIIKCWRLLGRPSEWQS